MPRVLNSKIDGLPAGSVYIGRPSKWGNFFEPGRSLENYRLYLESRPDLIEAAKKELRGKDLVCFCAPKLCHGDILLRIANED